MEDLKITIEPKKNYNRIKIMNLAINLTKRKNVKAHTLKTTKYHWNKLKIDQWGCSCVPRGRRMPPLPASLSAAGSTHASAPGPQPRRCAPSPPPSRLRGSKFQLPPSPSKWPQQPLGAWGLSEKGSNNTAWSPGRSSLGNIPELLALPST